MSVNAAGRNSPTQGMLVVVSETEQPDQLTALAQTVLRREEETGDDWDLVNRHTPHQKARTPPPEVVLPTLSGRVENSSPKASAEKPANLGEAPPVLEQETSCLKKTWEIVSSLIEKIVSTIFTFLCSSSKSNPPNDVSEGRQMVEMRRAPTTALDLMREPQPEQGHVDLTSSTVFV